MFRKEKMKGGGREKDNFIGENSYLTSNHHHHQHSSGSCSYDTTSRYNLSDVGSSSMVHPFDPSQYSTKKNHLVDHQYYVRPSVSDSSWYIGSNLNGDGGVTMDDLSLAMEFQKLGIGNRMSNDVVPSDHGRFGRHLDGVRLDDCNAENFGCLEGFGNGFSYGGAPSLYKDNRKYRSLGERVRTFGDSVGSISPYGGGVGQQDCLTNFPLGETTQQLDEHYGNGVPIMRGNRLYGDGMSSYDSSDYLGNGGRVSRVNEHFDSGSLIHRRDGFYGNEIPVHVQSMYGAPIVDDTFQQYIMEGCKEVLNPWTSSQNYGALLQNYGGHVLGKLGGLNSLGSSQLLHSKQALSRRNILYNTMREKMRASEQRDSRPIELLKKMRQPYTGVGLNGSVGHNNCSSGRKKNLFNCQTMHKIEERIFDLNGSIQRERSGGIGSPVGSCDSLVLETMYSSLAEVQSNIYHMAKDQHGCRFLQKKFEDGSFEDKQTIFNKIIDHVVELMINPFGNYLIQKLLDVCNEEQRMKIIHVVTKDQGELVRICLNTHGTRVVQKLIENLKTRNQISIIIRALEPGFLDLIQDLNGNHVVQRCLQCLNCDDNKFIFDAAAQFCVEIATHRHGCCVLQHCIAHSNGDHRKKLIEKICSNGLILAQDPFGNYVVQYLIDELNFPSAAAQLISQFEGHYVHLSMQKFSSHVVEKCLKFIEESQARIVFELLSVPHFEQLLQDPYANYVVQSALEVTKGAVNESLVAAVRPHSTLRTNPYCKKIFTRGLINN